MALCVSICIPAYNEQSNIAGLLISLLNQVTKEVQITEIVVISSGSTDNTEGIVKQFSKRDSRIRLIHQDKRQGKTSAINEFLKITRNDLIVLESADTIPDKQTIERLCLPLKESRVGMVGAHPVPVNNQSSFLGYTSHLEWALHDRISIRAPKCGELVAFRKLFEVIPTDTAVDEAWIEYEIARRHYEIVYAPQAIVYNRGPETIGDLVKQRRRIACGHVDLEKRTHFDVASSKLSFVLLATLHEFPVKDPKKWLFFGGAFAIESICKLLGYYDYYNRKEKHSVWEISKTTKSVGINVS